MTRAKKQARTSSPAAPPCRMTLDEWQAEAKRLGGGDPLDCPFRCPSCEHLATARDFQRETGDPKAAGRAPHECLGRLWLGTAREAEIGRYGDRQPCDWTTAGLFGGLGRSIVVVYPDGHEVEAFPFAEPEVPSC